MISFVIPAHNEQSLIERTVTAIRTAADELALLHEIIVVNDSSTDDTGRVAAASGADVIDVAFRQIAATRNAGANATSGEILFFVDADTVINAEAIQAALEILRGRAVGGGCVFTFDGVLPAWARFMYPIAVFLSRRLNLVGGCCLFCRRDAFDAVGGFDENYFAAEEAAFIQALKRIGRFEIPEPTVITSGRKLHAYSSWEILSPAYRWLIRGPQTFQQREGLDIWYGPRSSVD